MESLRVARLHARYRLPAPAGAHQARLDALFAGSVRDCLELALARAAVPVHEEICVRHVHARTRLQLSRPDGALAIDWSLALAEELGDVIARGGPDVVRYGSRAHALVDALAGGAAGDLSRAWAWRQMGLWRAAPDLPPAAAAEQALQALVREARAAVAVLAAVARLGALEALVERVGDRTWTALSAAALEAAGAPAAWAVPEEVEGAGAARLVEEADRARTAAVVAEVRARSTLAAAAMRQADRLRERTALRRALAVLAVLEADPVAVRGAVRTVRWLLGEVERLLVAERGVLVARDHEPARVTPGATIAADDAPARGLEGRHPEAEPADREARARPAADDEDEAAPTRRELAPEVGASRRPSSSIPGGEDDHRQAPPPPVDAREERVVRGPEPSPARPDGLVRAKAGTPADAHAWPARSCADAPPECPLPEVRAGARTRAGGLLFLLHLVEETGLPARVPADPRLAARSWRWFLYRLAGVLVPDVDEPAALAFAGLGPLAEAPGRDEAPPDDAERAALEDCRALVLDALHVRLRREPRDPALAQWTARRAAEIVADPAWLEVRFALEDASTEIRRCGLDRDPGWIPWLGAVVRFLYV
jgi:hypothetical protein